MYEFCILTADRGADFAARIQTLGVDVTRRTDPISDAVTIIAIPDDIEDALLDQIEAWYETEMRQNEAAARARAEDEHRAAGIWVPLSQGGGSLARIDPELMNRILSVLTPDELSQFVACIAQAVERPDTTPLCAPDKGGG